MKNNNVVLAIVLSAAVLSCLVARARAIAQGQECLDDVPAWAWDIQDSNVKIEFLESFFENFELPLDVQTISCDQKERKRYLANFTESCAARLLAQVPLPIVRGVFVFLRSRVRRVSSMCVIM